jgi:hypothetical protein
MSCALPAGNRRSRKCVRCKAGGRPYLPVPARPASNRTLARQIARVHAGTITVTPPEYDTLKDRVRSLLESYREEAAARETRRLRQLNLLVQADLAQSVRGILLAQRIRLNASDRRR